MLIETLLTVMLAQPIAVEDRGLTLAEREALLTPVAAAILMATADRTEIAALIATGFQESGWKSAILNDRCRKGPNDPACDHGKALGPWQVHRVACPLAFGHEPGATIAKVEAAECAVRLLRGGRKACGSWEGSFARYATGHSCSWSGAPARARATWLARANLHLAEQAPSLVP